MQCLDTRVEARDGQVELFGREVVHRRSDGREVEHTQAHPWAVLGRPLVAPPSEAGPPRGRHEGLEACQLTFEEGACRGEM